MKKIRFFVMVAFLSLCSTQVFEVEFLPLAIYIKEKIDGDQSYTRSRSTCNDLMNQSEFWLHPATLSLSVYKQAQFYLNPKSAILPEVLPHYQNQVESSELSCIAELLIKQSITYDPNTVYFKYDVDKPIYNLYDEWYSGLAQSFTGQVMLATHIKTGDPKYLDLARKIANFLFVDVQNGGVLLKKSAQEYWYVEYANRSIDIPEVLNGHLLALDFLYWLSIYDKENSQKWKILFELGMNTTVNDIDDYLGIAWSYYDKKGTIANGKYHRFHIAQLERYKKFDQTGKLESAQKKMIYQLYSPTGVLYRLVQQPSKLLVFIFMIFAFIYSSIIYGLLVWKRK